MNCIRDEHPLEEKLTEYALHEENESVKEHLLSCPSCSRYIKEIRSVKRIIQSLPDEDVPESIRKEIKNSTQSNNSFNSWFEFSLLHWYKNPFIIGLFIISAIIFFYIFFVFIL